MSAPISVNPAIQLTVEPTPGFEGDATFDGGWSAWLSDMATAALSDISLC
jgi:hypothetical protein